MIFPTLIFHIEKWKFNSEFGVYVSNMGHFKDRQKRNLSCKIQKNTGYCAVKTEKGMVKSHRLVLVTWRPIPNREEMTVDHLNHNKRDNRLSNLEWVTEEENLRRAQGDICNFQDSRDKVVFKNNVRINGIVMPIDKAVEFIVYGPTNSNSNRSKIKKYLQNFLADPNPNRLKITKYGYFLEKT